jgi:hypothetical protein
MNTKMTRNRKANLAIRLLESKKGALAEPSPAAAVDENPLND